MTASKTTRFLQATMRPVLACALAAAVAVSLTPSPGAGRALAQDLATASPVAVQTQADAQKETVYVIDSADVTYKYKRPSESRYRTDHGSPTYKYNENGLLSPSSCPSKYDASGNLMSRVSIA